MAKIQSVVLDNGLIFEVGDKVKYKQQIGTTVYLKGRVSQFSYTNSTYAPLIARIDNVAWVSVEKLLKVK